MAYLTPTAPLTTERGAVTPLGFSTRLIVDVTAEAVHDAIGHTPPAEPWRFTGAACGMRWGVMRHRVRSTDHYAVTLTGGTIALSHKFPTPYASPDGAWTERTMQRLQGMLWEDSDGIELEDAPARVITEWSRRSRARMVRALAEIDHDTWTADGTLGMVTLTLPGDWLAVAPTGSHFKGMLRRLQWRWRREIGPWQVCWKLEFQRRGAPHLHMMMKCPAMVGRETFERWVSRTWASIVNADNTACANCVERCSCSAPDTEYTRHLRAGTNVDFGANTTDPKRIAVYFLKHSSKTQDSKEYQHIVPAAWRAPGNGPGRFWGIAGLKRHAATVELDRQTWVELRRILRGVHRGNRARTALARRAHVVSEMGETWRRATLLDLSVYGAGRDRLLASATGGGWILSNDAPALLHLVAQWLASRDG